LSARLIHAQATTMRIAPRGLTREQSWFGPRSARSPFGGRTIVPTSGISTEIVERAVINPAPFGVFHEHGTTRSGVAPATAATSTEFLSTPLASVIESGAQIELGRFLAMSASIALLQRDVLGVLPLLGAVPTPPQLTALGTLGFADSFMPIDRPVRVSRLALTTRFSSRSGSGSTELDRFMRTAIEALRFAVEPYPLNPRLAILGGRSSDRFVIRNRRSVAAWSAGAGFTLINVAAMQAGGADLGLFDLAAILAGARCVLIEDAAQAGLLGFCDPGTTVLEIAVDGWTDPRIAAMCRLFGLEWRMVLAPAPSYPVLQSNPFGTEAALHTEIDIDCLAAAVAHAAP